MMPTLDYSLGPSFPPLEVRLTSLLNIKQHGNISHNTTHDNMRMYEYLKNPSVMTTLVVNQFMTLLGVSA